MRLEHHLVGGYVRYISPHIYYIILLLLKDISTTVAVGIRTHILRTQPSEHKSDALNRSTMALHALRFQGIYNT